VEKSNEAIYHHTLWETALRDAAGPLAAYLTPNTYGLEGVRVKPIAGGSDDLFLEEIKARLDLGRAKECAKLLETLHRETTSVYRHEISFSQGAIRGKIHLPRLVIELARGGIRGVPVLRAERHLATPENLLVSEVLRLSMRVVKPWQSRKGAESSFALDLIKKLQSIESTHPWVELRSLPRPLLSELVALVLGRITAGVIPPSGAIAELAKMFAGKLGDAKAFEFGAESLSFLITQDPRFENKLFELICVGWIIKAINSFADNPPLINRNGLKAAGREPLLKASYHSHQIEMYFQNTGGVLNKGCWLDNKNGHPLGALPDVVLKVTKDGVSKLVILDAKNRSGTSRSEVAYKMLGYKENLQLTPYYSIGIYPAYRDDYTEQRFNKDSEFLILARVPLLHTESAVGNLTKVLLDEIFILS
jgi:hypothetical protein